MRLWASLLSVLLLSALVRAVGITEPFVHSFDSAFQEALSLAHLKYGLAVTKGLAVTAVLDGRPIYHAAHPPLLQLIYAGLYSVFGVNEWVSRGVSIIACLSTICFLWLVLIKNAHLKSALVACLIFALLPLSVRFGRTTNYEPLSVAMISALCFAYFHRERWYGFPLMCAIAVVGGLFEWTVYLSFPALLLALLFFDRRWENIKSLILPSLLAGVTLLCLFAYQYDVLGKIPVFEHARVRSNPWMIAKLPSKEELLSRLEDVNLCLVFLFWGWANLFAKDMSEGLKITVTYFTIVPLLFFAFASQLFLSHPIALYYFVPLLAVSVGSAFTGKRNYPALALLLIVLALSLVRDKEVLNERNYFHYNIMKMIGNENESRDFYAFDSSAVGYLRAYLGVETIHPLGGNEPSFEEIVSNDKVRYIMLDTENPEVAYVRNIVTQANTFFLKWRFPTAEVWERGENKNVIRLTNMLDRAQLPPPTPHSWEMPQAQMLGVEREVKFGISHHARQGEESVIVFRSLAGDGVFKTTARFDPNVCDSKLTNGVRYSVTIDFGDRRQTESGAISPADGCVPKEVVIDLGKKGKMIDILLAVDAIGSNSYDRFFWEDPRIELKEE